MTATLVLDTIVRWRPKKLDRNLGDVRGYLTERFDTRHRVLLAT